MARSALSRFKTSAVGLALRPAYDLANALTDYRLSGSNRPCVGINSVRTGAALLKRVRRLADREQELTASREALNCVANVVHRLEPQVARTATRMALDALPYKFVSGELLGSAARLGIDLPTSFGACLTMRAAKRRFGDLPERTLSPKRAAYEFVDRLDAPRPRTLEHGIPLADITQLDSVVIKPVGGRSSQGVYLVFGPDRIFDVYNSRTLDCWGAMCRQIARDVKAGMHSTDEWIVEELILAEDGTLARDLKLFSFYGRAPLVLEMSRYPRITHRWLTREGDDIETGRHERTITGGTNGLAEAVQMAERISAAIPAPFMRIDLLNGHDGPVFGEFTAQPGDYQRFNHETDTWLGDLFLEAEERLFRDLLGGKRFDAFKAQVAVRVAIVS